MSISPIYLESQDDTKRETDYDFKKVEYHDIYNTKVASGVHQPLLSLGEVAPIDASRVKPHFSEDEYSKILDQHQTLSAKKFESGLSTQEESLRAYLRWQLDRFEMSESKASLDALWQGVRLLQDAADHVNQIRKHAPKARRGK